MRYLYIFVQLSILVIQCSCDLKFAGWGKACQMPDPKGMELLDPKNECDAGRGLSCKTYTQGLLCGCIGSLTYDRRSEECRRKVSSACHIKSPEEYDSQPFNHKCHSNAECVLYSGTLIGGKSDEGRNVAKPMCLCKHGYIASKDLSECIDPNSGSSLQSSVFVIFGISILLLILHQ